MYLPNDLKRLVDSLHDNSEIWITTNGLEWVINKRFYLEQMHNAGGLLPNHGGVNTLSTIVTGNITSIERKLVRVVGKQTPLSANDNSEYLVHISVCLSWEWLGEFAVRECDVKP